MLKAIIFDIWETLGTKNIGISKSLQANFNIPKSPDFLKKYEAAVQLDAWESEETMATNFLTTFNLAVTKANQDFVVLLFRQGVERATLFDGMADLIKELYEKYHLATLSNTTIFESDVLRRWGVDKYFNAQVFSWQLHSLKPAAENFRAVCTALSVEPQECLYIDDSEENVVAARAFGMSAEQFASVAELKKSLNSFAASLV